MGIKKLHLGRKDNSIFAKNMLQFIEGNWDFSPLGDSYIEMENVSTTSTTIVSNAISTLQDICVSNINRLIFGHLSISSFRSKFNFLCKQIKGSIDIFMLPEPKMDDNLPLGQFLTDGFQTPFRFDRDKNRGWNNVVYTGGHSS